VKIITVDFETYYDRDYSLSKMGIDEYVTDPRFEIIGMGITVGDKDPLWVTEPIEVAGVIATIPWSECAVRCHHTQFDGFILSHHYGVKPKLWMDTLAQARMLEPCEASHGLAAVAKRRGLPDKGTAVLIAIGKRRADFTPQELAEYGDYCKHDVHLCREIGRWADPLTPALSVALIDMFTRMYTEPAMVGDEASMRKRVADEIARKEALLADSGTFKDVIMSNNKLADLLRSYGVGPPMKVSAATGKPALAFAKTDKEFQALLEHDDPRVQAVVAARLGVKSTIAETRALRFANMAARGPMPVYINFWGAKTTGRASGGDRCLSGETWITVKRSGEVLDILIPMLQPTDEVWDGEDFVRHGGLLFQGFREVIEHDGVVGTPDHKVFVVGREEPVELAFAAREGLALQTGS
jgi:predicted component of type VI protein secretion system